MNAAAACPSNALPASVRKRFAAGDLPASFAKDFAGSRTAEVSGFWVQVVFEDAACMRTNKSWRHGGQELACWSAEMVECPDTSMW